MRIYGKGKSRSFRAVWAAEEAGLAYEYIEVEFGGKGEHGTNGEIYRQLNFQGKVPTLVDGNLVLTESGAIVNYLATKNTLATKNPAAELIPQGDAQQRALYDQLAFFVLSDLEQPLWTNGKHRFALPEEQRVPQILETTKWEFNKSQTALTKLIGETPTFALAKRFTMADILLAHTLAWAENFKFDVHPGLKKYKDQLYARPACRAALAKLAS